MTAGVTSFKGLSSCTGSPEGKAAAGSLPGGVQGFPAAQKPGVPLESLLTTGGGCGRRKDIT